MEGDQPVQRHRYAQQPLQPQNGVQEHCPGEMVPNQENMEGDQPVERHRYAQQPLQPQNGVQEHCLGETGLPLSVFLAVLT